MRRLLLIAAIAIVPLGIVGLLLVMTKQAPETLQPMTLTIWGASEDTEALAPLIAEYRKTHPQIQVTYVPQSADLYIQNLIDAWAKGTGPDLFFAPNFLVGQMSQYAAAMPADLSVQIVKTTKGILGTQQKVVTQRQAALPISTYQDAYVDAVLSDAYFGGQLWGLPLTMDTLVTYYNKDLLNDAKVFEPAKTWKDLIDQITNNQLTALDPQNAILRSGAALGTANNLPYAADLLSLLMMQNGVRMVGPDGKVAFKTDQGQNTVDFYTSFAVQSKTNYSWSADLQNARDLFLQGKVAYYFGTFEDRTAIAASGLNWSVAPMLHLDPAGDNDAVSNTQRKVNAARYQMLMVAKSTVTKKTTAAAWNLLTFLTRTASAQQFIKTTNRPAALKSILNAQGSDPVLGVYAGQLLTARTWYHGRDGIHAEQYLNNLITSVSGGQSDIEEALNLAGDQIDSTL